MPSSSSTLPHHLAIIMDGNGRWAKSRGLPRLSGHRKGAVSVRRVVTHCRNLGIKVLTLFAFSSENWSRPSSEVFSLMSLLSSFLFKERQTILSNGIRFSVIGDLEMLPEKPRKLIANLVEISKDNQDMVLCLALSFGGREEIVSMTKRIASLCLEGACSLNEIDTATVSKHLWSSELGPVDLLIRTSGEQRISNFLLWSLAYSELYFTDTLWPDFDEQCLDAAIESFCSRSRRFGNVS